MNTTTKKTKIEKIDINPSVGSMLKVDGRTFMVLKCLKFKLRVREVFIRPTKGNVTGMSVGDFYEVSNIVPDKPKINSKKNQKKPIH